MIFRKIALFLILIQGVLMCSTLETIDIKGKKIDIVYEKDSSLPVAYMKLVFIGGGYIADDGKVGQAKFTSKMLGEGTKSLGSVKFATNLEERAIKFSVSSGFETSTIDISSLKEQFGYGVNSLVELLKDPNFTKSTFEKVQGSLIANSMKREDDFDTVAENLLKSNLFYKTPLESDGLGKKSDIHKIKLNDIEAFYKKYYGLKNVAFVIGGDIELKDAKKEIAKILAVLNDGESPTEPFFEANKDTKDKSVYKNTKQAYVYFGAPLKMSPKDKDVYKLKVASFILGSSGFGSRLMEEIRVKNGLAYSAYSRYIVNKTHSYFSGYLQTKLETEDKAKELVKKVIEDFVKNGATQKELDGAKKFILGSEPLRNETLSQRLSRSWNEHYLGLGIGHNEEELESIRNLNLEDLNKFIKSHPEITGISFAVVNAKK
jgi:predicted Zn-dependent peptidase